MTNTELMWEGRVQAWRDSGMTAELFAEGKGYKPTTLKWHSSKLRRSAKSPKRARNEAPRGVVLARVVRVGSTSPVARAITITIGNAKIEVTTGFEPGLLRAVVACLGGAP